MYAVSNEIQKHKSKQGENMETKQETKTTWQKRVKSTQTKEGAKRTRKGK